jgi:hypothetical protein
VQMWNGFHPPESKTNATGHGIGNIKAPTTDIAGWVPAASTNRQHITNSIPSTQHGPMLGPFLTPSTGLWTSSPIWHRATPQDQQLAAASAGPLADNGPNNAEPAVTTAAEQVVSLRAGQPFRREWEQETKNGGTGFQARPGIRKEGEYIALQRNPYGIQSGFGHNPHVGPDNGYCNEIWGGIPVRVGKMKWPDTWKKSNS